MTPIEDEVQRLRRENADLRKDMEYVAHVHSHGYECFNAICQICTKWPCGPADCHFEWIGGRKDK